MAPADHRAADYSFDPPPPTPDPLPDPPPPPQNDYSAQTESASALREDLESLSSYNRKLVEQLTPFAGEHGAIEDAAETLARLLTELRFLRTVPASSGAVDDPAVDPNAPMTQDEIAALLDGHAHDVIDIVSSADRRGGRDASDLDAIESAELAGKSRKTVLEAIHARRAKIQP